MDYLQYLNCNFPESIKIPLKLLDGRIMSDEFIKVATQEIRDEIASIKKILENCKDDSQVFENSTLLEKHMHKIKGLAPMMGKKKIGDIATLNDILLNHIVEGKKLKNIYSVLCESNFFMEKSIENRDDDWEKLKQKIETNYSNFLD
jgi:HPt (histidine-containing phosphotransfer) domain-containing protein